MANGIRTGDLRGKSSKFREGSGVRQTEDISAETLWNNNKDEDNSPKTLNDKNVNIPDLYKCIYKYVFFKKNISTYDIFPEYSTPYQEDTEFNTFPKIISPKVNVIARREFELTYFEAAVWHVSQKLHIIIKSCW